MDFSEKIIDKKEELLDEFEKLTLEEIAVKIKQASNRDDSLIFKIACLFVFKKSLQHANSGI